MVCHHGKVIVKVPQVLHNQSPMNAEQRQATADPQTISSHLGRVSVCRLVFSSFIIPINYYYTALNLYSFYCPTDSACYVEG